MSGSVPLERSLRYSSAAAKRGSLAAMTSRSSTMARSGSRLARIKATVSMAWAHTFEKLFAGAEIVLRSEQPDAQGYQIRLQIQLLQLDVSEVGRHGSILLKLEGLCSIRSLKRLFAITATTV
jgi:hypothetical protein